MLYHVIYSILYYAVYTFGAQLTAAAGSNRGRTRRSADSSPAGAYSIG